RCVLAAMSASNGYGSFHKTCESKIHPYWKPAASAWRVKARMRSTEMSGFSVMPNCMAQPLSSLVFVTRFSSLLELCGSEVRQFSIEFFIHLGQWCKPMWRAIVQDNGRTNGL